MSYDLTIQPTDANRGAQRAQVETFIATLPDVRQGSPGIFEYGNPSRRLLVQIFTEQTKMIDSVGVTVPAAYSTTSCEMALLLSFKIAEHLDWRVFDPQLGDYLDKNTAAEVVQQQKEIGDTDDEVLTRCAKGKASFAEDFKKQLCKHGGVLLISTLVIAGMITGYLVVSRGLAENRFPWLFFGLAAVLHGARALTCAVWQGIRRRS